MVVVINNLNIGKKEVSFDELLTNGDFLYKISSRLDYLEDQIFGKIMQESDSGNYVGEDEILNLLDSKIGE